MDPSALIFVALAVAWAAYLIPQALEHHEESTRSRSIDRFSAGLRILARREPRGRRRTALVTVADERPEPEPAPAEPAVTYVAVPPTAGQLRARRRAAGRAARRRRRVLDLLVAANVVVAALAILGRVAWHWQGVPAGLVVVWLVLCRLMKIRERRALTAPAMRRVDLSLTGPLPAVTDVTAAGLTGELDVAALVADVDDLTSDLPVVVAELAPAPPVPAVSGGWAPQHFVVPTYVDKERVRRSVRTIDLDSTGVWSSGRNDADSLLVREAAQAAEAGAQAPARDADRTADERPRATGS